MTHTTPLRSLWQAPPSHFTGSFTRPGFRRFAERVTAPSLNVEEHIITRSVTAIERPAAWKAPGTFAESGAWRADSLTSSLTRLVEKAPGRNWHGSRSCLGPR